MFNLFASFPARTPSTMLRTPLTYRAFSQGKHELRTGIYAGSFDPPSSGHLDIIKRGTKLVDKLYVGIAVNSMKQ